LGDSQEMRFRRDEKGDIGMASEADFLRCVSALDKVSVAFLGAQSGLGAPMHYEADLAGFKLMEVVVRHANAVSGIALLPTPGLHFISAWVLLRSAFEVALTAYWLTIDDDWKEREARWVGWMAGEEEYQRKLGGDLRPISEHGSQKFKDHANQLEARRLAIMQLLPKDSRDRRPSIPKMIEECGIEKKRYIVYRIGSQFTHGGPTVCQELFETGENYIRIKDVDYSNWANLFQLASWSIAQPGQTTLLRAGASEVAITNVLAAHENLCVVASALEK
jgi:hypothetical protein